MFCHHIIEIQIIHQVNNIMVASPASPTIYMYENMVPILKI